MHPVDVSRVRARAAEFCDPLKRQLFIIGRAWCTRPRRTMIDDSVAVYKTERERGGVGDNYGCGRG